MNQQEKEFWKVGEDIFLQVLETDSFIYRYYVNAVSENVGVFYDKLTKKWDTAIVKNRKIKPQNLSVNTYVHQLHFAA